MSDALKPFELLEQQVRRVSSLLGEITNAKSLPGYYARLAGNLQIHTGSSYSNADIGLRLATAAKLAQQNAAEEMRRQGEIERDEKIAAALREIGAIRDVLCSMAASACIDIGVRCREEAGGPQQ